MSNLDTIEAVALAATENVRDNGYRIMAPDGTVIVEYKHSPHPNAEADGALFGRAREYVLTLVAAVREREAQSASLSAAAREWIDAGDAWLRLVDGTVGSESDVLAASDRLVAARKRLAALVP